MARSGRGLTLVELLAIVAIVAVLVVVALPWWLESVDRKKMKKTMMDMRTCSTALETYSLDRLQYVASTECAVIKLRPHLEPTYVKSLPARDEWGTELRYIGVRDEYTITSYGSDRRAGGGGAVASNGTTTNYKHDIIFGRGSFVQWPEGMEN